MQPPKQQQSLFQQANRTSHEQQQTTPIRAELQLLSCLFSPHKDKLHQGTSHAQSSFAAAHQQLDSSPGSQHGLLQAMAYTAGAQLRSVTDNLYHALLHGHESASGLQNGCFLIGTAAGHVLCCSLRYAFLGGADQQQSAADQSQSAADKQQWRLQQQVGQVSAQQHDGQAGHTQHSKQCQQLGPQKLLLLDMQQPVVALVATASDTPHTLQDKEQQLGAHAPVPGNKMPEQLQQQQQQQRSNHMPACDAVYIVCGNGCCICLTALSSPRVQPALSTAVRVVHDRGGPDACLYLNHLQLTEWQLPIFVQAAELCGTVLLMLSNGRLYACVLGSSTVNASAQDVNRTTAPKVPTNHHQAEGTALGIAKSNPGMTTLQRLTQAQQAQQEASKMPTFLTPVALSLPAAVVKFSVCPNTHTIAVLTTTGCWLAVALPPGAELLIGGTQAISKSRVQLHLRQVMSALDIIAVGRQLLQHSISQHDFVLNALAHELHLVKELCAHQRHHQQRVLVNAALQTAKGSNIAATKGLGRLPGTTHGVSPSMNLFQRMATLAGATVLPSHISPSTADSQDTAALVPCLCCEVTIDGLWSVASGMHAPQLQLGATAHISNHSKYHIGPGWQLLFRFLPELAHAMGWQNTTQMNELPSGASCSTSVLLPIGSGMSSATHACQGCAVPGQSVFASSAAQSSWGGACKADSWQWLQGGWLQIWLIKPGADSRSAMSHTRHQPAASGDATSSSRHADSAMLLLSQHHLSAVSMARLTTANQAALACRPMFNRTLQSTPQGLGVGGGAVDARFRSQIGFRGISGQNAGGTSSDMSRIAAPREYTCYVPFAAGEVVISPQAKRSHSSKPVQPQQQTKQHTANACLHTWLSEVLWECSVPLQQPIAPGMHQNETSVPSMQCMGGYQTHIQFGSTAVGVSWNPATAGSSSLTATDRITAHSMTNRRQTRLQCQAMPVKVQSSNPQAIAEVHKALLGRLLHDVHTQVASQCTKIAQQHSNKDIPQERHQTHEPHQRSQHQDGQQPPGAQWRLVSSRQQLQQSLKRLRALQSQVLLLRAAADEVIDLRQLASSACNPDGEPVAELQQQQQQQQQNYSTKGESASFHELTGMDVDKCTVLETKQSSAMHQLLTKADILRRKLEACYGSMLLAAGESMTVCMVT
eukprot:jgi/Chrzof1/1731/Cz10g18270.t1